MKITIKEYLFPLGAAIACLAPSFFMHSCANTTQAPTGGKKDTIPPALYWTQPSPGSVQVDTHKTKIVFGFDEYVTIKNQQNIFLSPPQKKAPKAKVKGKSIVVSFEEPLEKNTTYTLNFTDAIADNNESNMFPGYTYVFSTGEVIDSMLISGTVRDCNTLNPIKGATVMLYKDQSDSAIFKSRPFAASKTDDWGYFCIPYIPDTLYRLYALKDDNNDNLYQAENGELVGFVDSLIRPIVKVNDTLGQMQKYDMKDTLECLSRKSEYEIRLFKEESTKQKLMNKGRTADRRAYVTFMSKNAWIDSLWIKGYRSDQLITQFNLRQDSLEIWINDRRRTPDTLQLYINYRKTNDSTGVMEPSLEHYPLFIEALPKKSGRAARRNLKHEDTICVYKITAEPENVEQKGFSLEFDYPIIYENFDSLKFRYINPKQKEIQSSFTIEKDTLDLRHFTIRPKEKMLPGYEYILKVPYRAFRDINGFYSDSSEVKVSLPKDDKLSTIILDMQDVKGKLIVDLLNEKRDKTLRSYVIESDTQLTFPYLKEGKYAVRITFDYNKNSMVDTGNLLEHKQPEKVVFFKFKDDEEFIDLLPSAELTQIININELQ